MLQWKNYCTYIHLSSKTHKRKYTSCMKCEINWNWIEHTGEKRPKVKIGEKSKLGSNTWMQIGNAQTDELIQLSNQDWELKMQHRSIERRSWFNCSAVQFGPKPNSVSAFNWKHDQQLIYKKGKQTQITQMGSTSEAQFKCWNLYWAQAQFWVMCQFGTQMT